MIVLTTESMRYIFNLSNFEREKEFKEIALNHVIDQTGKNIKLYFKHVKYDLTVRRETINTKRIRRIETRLKRFWDNNMSYSIEVLIVDANEKLIKELKNVKD